MKHFAFLLPLIWLIGCVQSLHPLYRDGDITFDPAVAGTWTDENAKCRIDIAPASDQQLYRISYTDDDGKTGKFVAHLFKAKETLMLDLLPDDPNLVASDVYKAHLLPVHSFFVVEQTTPKIRITMMKLEWLKKFVEDHPDAIKHEKIDDRILLTAQPAEMQAFILEHLKDKDAFSDTSELTRIAPGSTSRPSR